MKKLDAKVGIVCGSGQMPLLVADEVARIHPEGVGGVFALCLTDEAATRLSDRIQVEKVGLGQAARAIKLLKANGAEYIIFAGKVDKTPVLASLKFDARGLKILASVRDFADDTIMAALVKELEGEGFEILPQTAVLERYLVQDKVYTKRRPSKEETADIAYGLDKARGLAKLGIGQAVVVRKRAVLAAEALEGTDETVRRGGQLAGGKGGVVVKAMKPGQDARFDVPTVGLATLRLLIGGGLTALALEAGSSFLIDQEEVVAAANGAKVAVVGVRGK